MIKYVLAILFVFILFTACDTSTQGAPTKALNTETHQLPVPERGFPDLVTKPKYTNICNGLAESGELKSIILSDAESSSSSINIVDKGNQKISVVTIDEPQEMVIGKEPSNKYLVVFKKNSDLKEEKNKIASINAIKNSDLSTKIKNEAKILKSVNAIALELDYDSVEEVKSLSNVENILADKIMYATLDSSNDAIRTHHLWAGGYTGSGVSVGVIDSGVDYTHSDFGCAKEEYFSNNCDNIKKGFDFANDDDDPMDDHGHGTHVASTISSRGEYWGVAPNTVIYPLKALFKSGAGYESDIIAAIEWAMDPNGDGNTQDHLDIISLSLGGPGHSDDLLSLAVDSATAAGVLAVVAAGNSGPLGNSNCRSSLFPDGSRESICSPGTSRTAITVGAFCESEHSSNCNDNIAKFSSRGPVMVGSTELSKPDIVAPGVKICAGQYFSAFDYSDERCWDDEHIGIDGTSMATPHISGIAALLLEKNPGLTPEEIKTLLLDATTDLGAPQILQGAGLIDASLLQEPPLVDEVIITFTAPATDRYYEEVISIATTREGIFNFSAPEDILISINPSPNEELVYDVGVSLDLNLVSSGWYIIPVSFEGSNFYIRIHVMPSVTSSAINFGSVKPNQGMQVVTGNLFLTNHRKSVQYVGLEADCALGQTIEVPGMKNGKIAVLPGDPLEVLIRQTIDTDILKPGFIHGRLRTKSDLQDFGADIETFAGNEVKVVYDENAKYLSSFGFDGSVHFSNDTICGPNYCRFFFFENYPEYVQYTIWDDYSSLNKEFLEQSMVVKATTEAEEISFLRSEAVYLQELKLQPSVPLRPVGFVNWIAYKDIPFSVILYSRSVEDYLDYDIVPELSYSFRTNIPPDLTYSMNALAMNYDPGRFSYAFINGTFGDGNSVFSRPNKDFIIDLNNKNLLSIFWSGEDPWTGGRIEDTDLFSQEIAYESENQLYAKLEYGEETHRNTAYLNTNTGALLKRTNGDFKDAEPITFIESPLVLKDFPVLWPPKLDHNIIIWYKFLDPYFYLDSSRSILSGKIFFYDSMYSSLGSQSHWDPSFGWVSTGYPMISWKGFVNDEEISSGTVDPLRTVHVFTIAPFDKLIFEVPYELGVTEIEYLMKQVDGVSPSMSALQFYQNNSLVDTFESGNLSIKFDAVADEIIVYSDGTSYNMEFVEGLYQATVPAGNLTFELRNDAMDIVIRLPDLLI